MLSLSSYESSDPRQLFSEGTEVEVSSDEEGFKGAWFKAFVVENLGSSAPKKRRKVLVEYWSLVTEDGFQPLREHVDLCHLRPLPPDAGAEDFEVGDVVDADYRDGWWTGVVRKVLGCDKYRVFFENPPDLIEFQKKQMRFHQDWVNGKWVRPLKEQKMTGSTFSSGTDVEVHFDNEDLSDAWIPAIVVKENDDNTFLVKYHNSKAKNWKDTVDFTHIRPAFPRNAGRIYELCDKVDAFSDFAWRVGEITKILPGKKYTVAFKHGNGMKSKEFSQTEIRPLVEWKDGKWLVWTKEGLVDLNLDLQEDLEHGANNISNADVLSQLGSLGLLDYTHETKSPQPTNSGKNLRKRSTDCSEDSVSITPNLTPVSSPNNGEHMHPLEKQENEVPNGSPSSDKACKARKFKLATTPASAIVGSTRLRKPVVPFIIESNSKRSKQHKGGGCEIKISDNVQRRGRTKKSQVKRTATSAVGKTRNVSSGAAGKDVEKEGIKGESEADIALGTTTNTSTGAAENVVEKEGIKGEAELPAALGKAGKNACPSTAENVVEKEGTAGKDAEKEGAAGKIVEKEGTAGKIVEKEGTAGKAVEKEGTAEKVVENEGIRKEAEGLIASSSTEEVQGSVAKSLVQFLSQELVNLPSDPKNNSDNASDDNSTEFKQQSSGGSNNKRKRGHVEELAVKACKTNGGVGGVVPPAQGGKETAGTAICSLDLNSNPLLKDLLNPSVVEAAVQSNLQDTSKGKSVHISGTNSATNEAESESIYTRVSSGTDDDDNQPLSKWFGGMQSQPGVLETKSLGKTVFDQRYKDRERASISKKAIVVHAFSGSEPEDSLRLPFVKSSPVWKAIDSMEVFGKMGQVPHFRPLYKCKEEHREGMAIGHMVTFSGLVDKISKLQCDDRGSIFHSTLETLQELEKHGFDVSLLRNRVNALLLIKDRQARARDESKDVERKIVEHAGEKAKLVGEIDDVCKKIRELQEKHALLKSLMENKEQDIRKLQQHVDNINQSAALEKQEFEKLAAAPFI
ncbi:DUF724 domain-containing protein 6-like isoform X2 [Humulus lupulus]|uniref:DUF724 domain-containing protein 6-like isoform X2 n=1 Tax=Humulus lupulus TaxID=3486 RepID=UPI002B405FE1|nr:DUF724 domain-containing protein 6-like isoform X2 [Humulus lupulus]